MYGKIYLNFTIFDEKTYSTIEHEKENFYLKQKQF